MKLATDIRTVKAGGVQASGTFAISMANQAHIMTILRDTLYSDKELAVLREYASNAWDAHRVVGKGDVPIRIHMPTPDEPVLIIRDFGPGLSEWDIFQVYTQYGESTKRDSNSTVGFLGIGSKAGFGYSDSFTVTSWHGGEKAVYVAFLDASDKGEINKIASSPCELDESGIEIRIAVQEKDILNFRKKAQHLFQFFTPRPEINIPLPDPRSEMTPHGFIERGEDRDWIAVMGCVPYALDLTQVETELYEAGLRRTTERIRGGLFFEIGEVQVSASREELKYSDKTKAAIVHKIQQLVQAYVEDTLATVSKAETSGWEKRKKVLFLSQVLSLPIPKTFAKYAERGVALFTADKPAKTFCLQTSDGHRYPSIQVDGKEDYYFRDDPRTLKGFTLRSYDLIISPLDLNTRDYGPIWAEFNELAKAAEIDGIPIKNLSSVSWYNPKGWAKRTVDRKHRVRSFRLLPESRFNKSKLSSLWEITQRDPQDEDVFVVLSEFKVRGMSDFYDKYRADSRLAAQLKLKLPDVYGYKTTAKKPVTEDSCKGRHYRQWREDFFRAALTDSHREIYRLHALSDLVDTFSTVPLEGGIQALTPVLGADHCCVQLLKSILSAIRKLEKTSSSMLQIAEALKPFSGTEGSGAERYPEVNAVLKRYPLLQKYSFEGLLKTPDPCWVDYIRLVDRDLERSSVKEEKQTNGHSDVHPNC